ncbi:OmpA family protein [Psychromonas sp. KJ10-2]|uniref:OmpA family protein n=1 Tax=Psychromonas sp. KJ10-2 TaxID=3391822 RepID=UPI0039B63F89
MNRKSVRLFFIISYLFLLVGCASESGYLIGPNEEKDENFSSDKVDVLFYFEKDASSSKQSILVHSETRLLGALLEGLYFPAAFCVGEKVISFEKRQKGFHAQDTITHTHYGIFKIDKDQPLFVGVSVNENGVIDTHITTKQEAEEVVGKIVNRTFLVNRKVENCAPPLVENEPVKEDVKLQTIELSADALFAFNSTKLNKNLQQQKMQYLIDQINRSDIAVTRIVVSGHSDRVGDADYNQVLSEQRASTIVDYLVSKGVRSRVESMGYGSKQSITQDKCSNQLSRSALIACLQPDRRVSVELWGSYQQKSTLSTAK